MSLYCPRTYPVIRLGQNALRTSFSVYFKTIAQMLHVIVDFMKRDGTPCDTRLYVDAPSGLGGSSLLPRKKALNENAIRLISIENNCTGNAFMNQKAFQRLAGKPLRVVCGSFGVIKDGGKIWWEWGTGQDSPIDEFLHCKVEPGKQNAHFWLEDPVSGCVYDVLPKYVLDVVLPIHKVQADLEGLICGVVISGETMESLMKRGLVYLPLNERKQKEIIEHRMSRMRLVHR